jgi:hypothetical protein
MEENPARKPLGKWSSQALGIGGLELIENAIPMTLEGIRCHVG